MMVGRFFLSILVSLLLRSLNLLNDGPLVSEISDHGQEMCSSTLVIQAEVMAMLKICVKLLWSVSA